MSRSPVATFRNAKGRALILSQSMNNDAYKDINLICSNGITKAHRPVIGEMSACLRQMLNDDVTTDTIYLQDYTKESVDMVLHLMYEGEAVCTSATLCQEAEELAILLGIHNVQCEMTAMEHADTQDGDQENETDLEELQDTTESEASDETDQSEDDGRGTPDSVSTVSTSETSCPSTASASTQTTPAPSPTPESSSSTAPAPAPGPRQRKPRLRMYRRRQNKYQMVVDLKPVPLGMCLVCSRAFRTEKEYRRHHRIEHLGGPPAIHNCDVCQKQFTTRAACLHHRVYHNPEKDHKCNHCGAAYHHKNTLDTHMNRCPGVPIIDIS